MYETLIALPSHSLAVPTIQTCSAKLSFAKRARPGEMTAPNSHILS